MSSLLLSRLGFAVAVLLGLAIPLPAADDPTTALRKFTVAPGLRVDLFAAEPDVRNPVALSIDERGRVFVVESDRRRSSVIDIRGHKEWLEADLAFRTVAERAEFLKREILPTQRAAIERLHQGGRGDFKDFNNDGVLDWHDLEVQSERLRLLEDTDGDGRADRVRVFADGFTNLVAGVAAGVLAWRGEVYFACIPDLWRMSESVNSKSVISAASPAPKTASLKADQLITKPLLTGFGVHIAFGGHDMHGLIFGPDGKLYWSIADRGTDTNLFARIKNPIPGLTPELLADSGCIFRANPDGTDFEVIAWGLRNPQELAFDDFGNLFTADNNGDGGDKARWHYVVEGADFGWRIGWQWLEAKPWQPKMGPWNGERLWHLANSNTAAWLLPPLAHIGHGPAGLAFNPGTGLPPQFDRHFFLCDFPGHVLMWTNITDGASFKIGPVTNLFGDLGPSDVAFGVDGGVYVTDWFKGFEKSDKGRIYRIHDPATDASKAVQETKRLLGEGMAKRSASELTGFLGHRDRRVRQEAQFALAKVEHFDRLAGLATDHANQLTRLHAIWAMSQIVRTNDRTELVREMEALLPLLKDSDPEMRAQSARLMGVGRLLAAQSQLDQLFADPSARVQYHAMVAYRDLFSGFGNKGGGHRHRMTMLDSLKQQANRLLGWNLSVSGASLMWPTMQMIKKLADHTHKEPYLEHASVMLLSQIMRISGPGFAPNSASFTASTSASVRLAVLHAYRRMEDPAISAFLADRDPQLVLEAARAINDVPIPAAYPQLAALLPTAAASSTSETDHFTLRRALNANFRLGQPEHALALAAFAAQTNASEPLRLEALEALAEWPQPAARDHIMGLSRPLQPREAVPAANALRPHLAALLSNAPKAVRLAALRAATTLGVKEADLFALLADQSQPTEVRVEALKSLGAQNDRRLAEAVKLALADPAETLRIEAGRWQSGSSDQTALWMKTMESGSIPEKQSTLAALATAPASADAILTKQLDALLAGTLAKELHLDVLEAARSRKSPPLAARLTQYESRLGTNDPLASYRSALHGGHATSGKTIFIENQQIACFRCHKINGEGGDVGPDLTGLGAAKGRDYLLEAIVQPNKVVAPGFENVLVEMKDGASYAGLVKSETDTELVLNSPEDGLMTLKKADVKLRQRGLSAMPEELATQLTRRELRDLIEFLATTR